jgi:hypothetical protein
VIDEADPARQLRLTAHNSRLVKERAAALLEVVRDAASSDPELDALWNRIQSEFYDNQRAIVQALHDRNGLKPGLDVARGADVLWTLNHPSLYWLLVEGRGWTPDQYEAWLAEILRAQLLRT